MSIPNFWNQSPAGLLAGIPDSPCTLEATIGVRRLGGSVGVSLLATFFQLTEQSYASSTPLAAASQLAEAALHGFRDTILLLTLVSFSGAVLALFLRTKGEEDS